MTLTKPELAAGWAEFKCSTHGELVACTKKARVWCRCGREAMPYRRGRRVRVKRK